MNENANEAAIACSLDAADLGDRRAIWETLARGALKEVRATDAGVEATYAASGEVERELRTLARLEADCCSFAEWRVSRRGRDLVLHVTSHGDGVAAVRGMFMPFSAKRPAPGGTR